MKYLVAKHDQATDAYNVPFTVVSRGQALRSFIDEAKNTESPINKHPEDYSLWVVGTFNDETGAITPELECIAKASDHTGA